MKMKMELVAQVAQDAREARLPAWARDELDTLRRKVADLQKALSTITECNAPARFWVDLGPSSNTPGRFYLQQSRVHFGVDPLDDSFNAQHLQMIHRDEGGQHYLEINGKQALFVRPYASNVLRIMV